MYRQEKSHLTYQTSGRLSAYLSDIDDCDEFHSSSKTVLTKTMKMTECIHSLLQHIKANCIEDNRSLLQAHHLTLNYNAELVEQFSMTWTPLKNAKFISGYLKIDFLTPTISLFKTADFKGDSIESLTNLIIDLTTLTFANGRDMNKTSLLIVKTKETETVSADNFQTVINDLETQGIYDNNIPTFLYIRHKESSGQFHKHFSNYG
jgi:hypothetical protein